MSDLRTRRRGVLAALLAVPLAALMFLPAAQAADQPSGTGFTATAERAAVDALVRTAGLSPADAVARLAAQRANAATAAELARQLGAGEAGSFLDARTGAPVVNVLDQASADRVRAAGATARVVRYST